MNWEVGISGLPFRNGAVPQRHLPKLHFRQSSDVAHIVFDSILWQSLCRSVREFACRVHIVVEIPNVHEDVQWTHPLLVKRSSRRGGDVSCVSFIQHLNPNTTHITCTGAVSSMQHEQPSVLNPASHHRSCYQLNDWWSGPSGPLAGWQRLRDTSCTIVMRMPNNKPHDGYEIILLSMMKNVACSHAVVCECCVRDKCLGVYYIMIYEFTHLGSCPTVHCASDHLKWICLFTAIFGLATRCDLRGRS